MSAAPRAATAAFTLAALPFLWSLLTHFSPLLANRAAEVVPPMFLGAYLGLSWAMLVLVFLSGALFGFACRDGAALPCLLAALPALWGFFAAPDASDISAIFLIAGLAGTALVGALFAARGLAPGWWPRLHLPLALLGGLALGLPLTR